MSLLEYLPGPLQSWLFPFQFMLLSLMHLPSTLYSLLSARDFSTLLSPSRLQSAWFARFWSTAGPLVRLSAETNVIPLLQGRIVSGVVLPPATTTTKTKKPVSGTVLEIGPGSGMWVSIFSDKYLLRDNENATEQQQQQQQHGQGQEKKPQVTKIYGVEPNADVHPLLRAQIEAAGLEDRYEIVPCGIEDLASSGRVPKGSVDCIVTVLCLCSIPDPQRNIAQLYEYLKPGGRWYVYEHVRCYPWQGRVLSLYQTLLNTVWPYFIGGCEMCRDTPKWIKEAGPWSDMDLCHMAEQPWYNIMPHAVGVLTK